MIDSTDKTALPINFILRKENKRLGLDLGRDHCRVIKNITRICVILE